MDPKAIIDDALEVTVVAQLHERGPQHPSPVVRMAAAAGWVAARPDRPGRPVRRPGLGRAATDGLAAWAPGWCWPDGAAERLERRARRAAWSGTARTGSRSSSWTPGRWRPCARRPRAIRATEPRLDVLVDNAGAIFPERTVGPDGIESDVRDARRGAVSAGARSCCRCCGRRPGRRSSRSPRAGMYTQALPLDDLGFARGTYEGARAYARAKRAQMALVREWARREPGTAGCASTRCTRAGRTPRGWRSRCRASTA